MGRIIAWLNSVSPILDVLEVLEIKGLGYLRMAGKKGQKAWNKREEWDYRDLLLLGKSELLRLGKKYKSAAGDETDKNYRFWLDCALALVLKDMPNKVNAEHKHSGEVDHYHTLTAKEFDRIEAEILGSSLSESEASRN